MRNLAITGLGGCGTAFLAREMNKSMQWTVEHEPKPSHNFMTFDDCGTRFDQDCYGEVNPFLRFLGVGIFNLSEQIGVIERDPLEVLKTWKKRNNGRYTDKELELHLKYGELLLNNIKRKYIILNGRPYYTCVIIDYDKMISDKEYLHKTLLKFYIHVPIEDLSLEPENSYQK